MSELTVLTALSDSRQEMEAGQLPGNPKRMLYDTDQVGCFG